MAWATTCRKPTWGRGLHPGIEAGVFFEVGQPATAGEPLIKAGLGAGWIFL
jgi:hypothetical protein